MNKTRRRSILDRLEATAGRFRLLAKQLSSLRIERQAMDQKILATEIEVEYLVGYMFQLDEPGNPRHNAMKGLHERRVEQARELFGQGHTQGEVAKMMGVSEKTAQRWYLRSLATPEPLSGQEDTE